jgi:pimeloyl-ACP methyl ester carboxylesterase
VPKPPLIFIPGWNIRAEFLENFAANFANYELHYFTPPMADSGAYQPAVKALRKFIAAKNLVKPVLLGWSMGGQIALLAARELRVRAVLLINSAAVFSRDAAARKSFYLACQRDFSGAAGHFLRLMHAKPAENLLLQKYFIGAKASALNYLRALHAADLTDAARDGHYPLGIFHARTDKIIPFAAAENLRALRPDALWRESAGAEHCPFFSHCDKITNLLDEVTHG